MDIVLVGPGSVLGEAPAERLVAAARPAAATLLEGRRVYRCLPKASGAQKVSLHFRAGF